MSIVFEFGIRDGVKDEWKDGGCHFIVQKNNVHCNSIRRMMKVWLQERHWKESVIVGGQKIIRLHLSRTKLWNHPKYTIYIYSYIDGLHNCAGQQIWCESHKNTSGRTFLFRSYFVKKKSCDLSKKDEDLKRKYQGYYKNRGKFESCLRKCIYVWLISSFSDTEKNHVQVFYSLRNTWE